MTPPGSGGSGGSGGSRGEASEGGGEFRTVLEPSVRGDVVVIAGAFFGAGFLILAKKMRDKVELSHYMVWQVQY